MPWALNVDEQRTLRSWSPSITDVRDLVPPRLDRLDRLGRALRLFSHLLAVGTKRPSLVVLDFT